MRQRGPRIEVSEALPPIADLSTASIGGEGAFQASLAALRDRAGSGDQAAVAAVAMLGDIAAEAGLSAMSSDAAPAALYDFAVAADADGRADAAVLALAVLAGSPDGRLAGLLGLSVLAARAGRIDEAAALVEPCMDAEARHPRALSIQGIVALERGDRTTAQSCLATASRIARRSEAYRGELQVAQRALLLMHLG